MDIVSFEKKNFFNRLIWVFPLVYVFHIWEESNGFALWVTNTLGGEMTLKPFLINNSVFMVINLACCYFAMRLQKRWMTFILFYWISAQEFWNFVLHVYTTVRFSTYSPGYYTAIFLYFPAYCYLSYLLLRDKHLHWTFWLLSLVLSVPALALTVWGGLYHFDRFPVHEWF